MGVIFLLAGVGICFTQPSGVPPDWIVYAAGVFFGLIGIFILLLQLMNKKYSKIAMVPVVVSFLVIFHWVSFGAGERIGTATTPFSVTHGVNVRTPFAILTLFFDLAIVAGVIHWFFKRRKD